MAKKKELKENVKKEKNVKTFCIRFTKEKVVKISLDLDTNEIKAEVLQ